MKVCTRCKEEKELVNFKLDYRNSDGRGAICKKCCSKQGCIYNKNHRPVINTRQRKCYYKTKLERPHIPLWRKAQVRARESGRPFTIVAEDVIIPTHCPILGIPLEKGVGHSSSNSPSLDALIPELGYVPGNINVISHKANTMKSNATLEELKKLVAWLESKET